MGFNSEGPLSVSVPQLQLLAVVQDKECVHALIPGTCCKSATTSVNSNHSDKDNRLLRLKDFGCKINKSVLVVIGWNRPPSAPEQMCRSLCQTTLESLSGLHLTTPCPEYRYKNVTFLRPFLSNFDWQIITHSQLNFLFLAKYFLTVQIGLKPFCQGSKACILFPWCNFSNPVIWGRGGCRVLYAVSIETLSRNRYT